MPQAQRRDLEVVRHFNAQGLVVNGITTLGRDFPLGEGWYRLLLRFGIVLTNTTGTTPIAEGELKVIKGLTLRTGAGEVLVNNLNGRALYKIAATKAGTPPDKNAIAAAAATYYVDIPIYFTDDRLMRPEDTILDTSRYSSLTLQVQMGGVADLLGVVGDSSVAFTLDAEIERTKGPLPPQGKPAFHIHYSAMPPLDASVDTSIEIERAPDLAIKRLYSHECSGGVAGVSFGGVNADDVKANESIVDQSGYIVQQRIHEMIQSQNRRDYSLESTLAGVTVHDMVRDGSLNTALYTGNRSRLRFTWDNKAGVAAGDIVSCVIEGVRGLK